LNNQKEELSYSNNFIERSHPEFISGSVSTSIQILKQVQDDFC